MGKFLYHDKLKLRLILNLQYMECQVLLKAITIYSTAFAKLKMFIKLFPSCPTANAQKYKNMVVK
jgi:hypothetical protein